MFPKVAITQQHKNLSQLNLANVKASIDRSSSPDPKRGKSREKQQNKLAQCM